MGKVKGIEIFVEEFTKGYIDCLLWTDEENAKEDAQSNAKDWEDINWSSSNITGSSTEEINSICRDFVVANWCDVLDYQATGREPEYIGQDFALSQNRHGTGFWDRGAGNLGDKLHKEAIVYGEASLYLGQDWRIYYLG